MLIIKKRPFLIRIFREVFYFLYNPPRILYYRIFRPKTTGVKVIVKNNKNKYLLIQIGYGSRNWSWPGGKVDRGESLLKAAKRELEEEAGLSIESLQQVGSKDYNWEGKRDTVYFFYGESDSEDLIIDGQEIINSDWFFLNDMPESLSTTVNDAFVLIPTK